LWQRIERDRQPVGVNAIPSSEVLRFRALLSLAFPPSEIHQIRPPQREDRPYEMTVAFMGMTGPQGVLPRHYTELLMERVWIKDYTLRDFLDLFNHRMVSLFYRAWEKHHCVVGYERALTGKVKDRVAHYLWALMGLGTQGLKERLQGVEDILLRYTGVLAQKPKSALALQRVLADYLHVPVNITQFIGQWLQLQEDDTTTLGITGRNNRLGQTAVAGHRCGISRQNSLCALAPWSSVNFLICSQVARPILCW
jgi:type VI secretion system protein ImpH